MVRNLGQWPLKRGLIAKIRPSDACGRNTVLFARERWYNFLGLKVIWGMSAYDQAMRYLATITMLVLALAMVQPVVGAAMKARTPL
ncbi:MAG: hypothetical protein HOF30_02625 [Rhodospirillaceae bacterium]|nr:hypothetical protein [Rhodospirillaceae bacterium]